MEEARQHSALRSLARRDRLRLPAASEATALISIDRGRTAKTASAKANNSAASLKTPLKQISNKHRDPLTDRLRGRNSGLERDPTWTRCSGVERRGDPGVCRARPVPRIHVASRLAMTAASAVGFLATTADRSQEPFDASWSRNHEALPGLNSARRLRLPLRRDSPIGKFCRAGFRGETSRPSRSWRTGR